jgi:hypothetical protein
MAGQSDGGVRFERVMWVLIGVCCNVFESDGVYWGPLP